VPCLIWLGALLLGVLTLLQEASDIYIGSGRATSADAGFRLADSCASDRFCEVVRLRPDTAATRSGIKTGDAVRLNRYWERKRRVDAGEQIGLTVRHEHRTERHLILTATVGKSIYSPIFIISSVALVAVWLALQLRFS